MRPTVGPSTHRPSTVLHPSMPTAKPSSMGKLSILPSNSHFNKGGAPKPPSMDNLDFTKPERYVREILDFLQSVTITTPDLNFQKSYKNLSGADA